MTSSAVALRPLGVAEILDGAVRIVRRNARAAFGFAMPVAVVQTVLTTLVLLAGIADPGLAVVSQLLDLVAATIGGTVLSGLLAPIVTSDAFGSPIPLGEGWRRARGTRGVLLLAVLGLGIGVAEAVGLVLALVGGFWLWGVWAVAGPAMTVEGLRPFAAVGRSFSLAKVRFWRVWGVRALGWLVTKILGLLLAVPFTVAAAFAGHFSFGLASGGITHPALYVTIVALGQLVSVMLIAPIFAAIDALIYLDLRMRVEGLDLVVTAPPLPVAVSAW